MSKQPLLKATHAGDLDLHGVKLQCYVLEDGRRVLSGRGMQSALDLGQSRGQKIPKLVASKGINQLVSKELELGIFSPIDFLTPFKFKAFGYEATVLVDLCQLLLDARKQGLLPERYAETAIKAEQLAISFAKVGIIALVDEVTGYQEVRDKAELRAFLKKFLLEEKTNYIDAYPDEFFETLFKMRGLNWSKANKGRNPQYFGHYINNYVYSRLGPEVLYSLRKLNPKNEHGARKTKFYNFTSPDYGFPKLKERLSILIAFAKAAGYNWNNWVRMIERAYPKYSQDGSTAPELPFNDEVA
jgi:hypothetical protein